MADAAELSYWHKRQLQNFEEKFNVVDKDKNGSLSYSEIYDMLKESGFAGTEDDFKVSFLFVLKVNYSTKS